MVAGPYPPEVNTTSSPPGLVTESAALKVGHGAEGGQWAEVFASLPIVETNVRAAPAHVDKLSMSLTAKAVTRVMVCCGSMALLPVTVVSRASKAFRTCFVPVR